MAEPFLGEIKIVGFNFPPRGWAKCDGQLLSISQNTALFSLFGTIYGGNGRTDFKLPDLRSRVPMHVGQGPGLSNRPIGASLGAENNTLNATNLPSHSHSFAVPAVAGAGPESEPDPTHSLAEGDFYSAANPDTTLRPGTTGNVGNSAPVNNIQPVQVVNFIVALVGLFPSRN